MERRRQVSEEGLLGRLEGFGREGVELSRWITGNIELLLTKTASRWFFDSQTPVIETAQEILSSLFPSTIYTKPSWRQALHIFLTETGLLVANRERLDWIHLSIAEYLASHELVKQARPKKWLWLADDSTTANLARFSLADQLAAGRIPVRSLRFLLGWRSSVTISSLISSGDLLTDAQILTLLKYALRSSVEYRNYPSRNRTCKCL